ncbi:hypothetical protein SE17_07495 [Kouleothrix aurantiaca]|uniref:Uncharacterized protein n=1 Tax=Kouleothrix aurantiaca TaxID=186479 RepID=A0A0P9FKP4_9CHLR|nr:hypothetical protein SE17_07495 [Kouleothrix aurantiaca]
MNVHKEQINPITYLVDATTGITHTLSAAAAWQGQGYSAMRQGFIPGDWYPSDIAYMAWSPDGQQIAINATGALYLFDASDLRINKQFNNGFMSQPQWSADGHTIFIGQYVLREGTPTSLSPSSQMPGTQSVQLDIDTGAMQPLDRDFTIPSWSPDRRQFVTATYSGQSLNLYSANGDFVRELSVGGFISYFLWSSDSKEIVAFVSVNPALTRVVRIRMSGEIQTITDEHVAGGMIESNAAWRSPDDALFAIPLEVASEPRIGIFDGQGHEWMVLNGMVVIGWRPHT